jgi:MFS transporter, ACS family, D-galactonate transporter
MPQSSSSAVVQPTASSGVATLDPKRWIIIGLLSVGVIIAFISRTNLSSALAYKPFVQMFHLSNIDRGALNSAFFWSYAALQIPAGWIVDRCGVKKPYAISFVVWCLASAATGLTHSLSQLTTMRVITGVGEAIVTPATYRWIRLNFPESESGLAVGIYVVGTKIGPAIGAPLAAWLIVAYNWQLMFVILGLVGLLWLIPWMILVKPDGPKAETPTTQRGSPTETVPFRNLMASPVIWGTVIVNFCAAYFVFYCMTWMPAYFVEQRHLSLSKMGLYSFFSFSGIAIVALVSAWVADLIIKRGRNPVAVRKAFVVAGFALACTELLGARTSSVNVALFWAVVSLSGLGLAAANHLALCRMSLVPAASVGLVTGMQNVSLSLAGIVGPVLSGWLLQTTGSYTAPMEAILFFLVLGGLACVVLLREKWAPIAITVPANPRTAAQS